MLGCRGAAGLLLRTTLGIELWRRGRAPLLMFAGGGNGPTPEAQAMHALALAAGVPAEAQLLEPWSRNTLGNARECSRMLRARDLDRIILVSDRAHLPRAAWLFRRAGLGVVACAGVRSAPRSWLHELAAWPKSLLRVLFSV